MIPIVIILGVMLLFSAISGGGSYASRGSDSYGSVSTRQKLTGVASYDADCVIDELGWIDDTEQLGEDLQYFFG